MSLFPLPPSPPSHPPHLLYRFCLNLFTSKWNLYLSERFPVIHPVETQWIEVEFSAEEAERKFHLITRRYRWFGSDFVVVAVVDVVDAVVFPHLIATWPRWFHIQKELNVRKDWIVLSFCWKFARLHRNWFADLMHVNAEWTRREGGGGRRTEEDRRRIGGNGKWLDKRKNRKRETCCSDIIIIAIIDFIDFTHRDFQKESFPCFKKKYLFISVALGFHLLPCIDLNIHSTVVKKNVLFLIALELEMAGKKSKMALIQW